MLISMDKLISSGIFASFQVPSNSTQYQFRKLAIFEKSKPSSSLIKEALVFFPLGHINDAITDLLCSFQNSSNAIVVYEDEPNLEIVLKLSIELSIPVFLLSPSITISEAIEKCYEFQLSDSFETQYQSVHILNSLVDIVSKSKSPEIDLLSAAMEILHYPIAYTTSDFLIQSMPPVPEELIPSKLKNTTTIGFEWEHALYGFDFSSTKYYPCLAIGLEETKIAGYLFQNAYSATLGVKIAIFPIRDNDIMYGYLTVAVDEDLELFSSFDGIILQEIQMLLRLENSKSAEIAQTINRYYDFILDELLESDSTDFEALMKKYSLAKKKMYDTYYVVMIGRPRPKVSTSPFHELLTAQQFNMLYSGFTEILGHNDFYVFERKDIIVLFVPGFNKPSDQLSEMIITILHELFKKDLEGIGFSNTVSKKELRKAYFQAKKALTISNLYSKNKPFHYHDLGIMEYFFDHDEQIDFGPLLDLHEEYIKPIVIYDEEHGTELLQTITAYIKCCFSTSDICSTLFIHKNTLYSRLNKISQILNKNLSDSDVLFHISFALKVREMLKAGLMETDQPPDLAQQQYAMNEYMTSEEY